FDIFNVKQWSRSNISTIFKQMSNVQYFSPSYSVGDCGSYKQDTLSSNYFLYDFRHCWSHGLYHRQSIPAANRISRCPSNSLLKSWFDITDPEYSPFEKYYKLEFSIIPYDSDLDCPIRTPLKVHISKQH